MDYFLSVRGRDGSGYSNREGAVKFLAVPGGAGHLHRGQEVRRTEWLAGVQDASGCQRLADGTVLDKGHILIFVHGFNTDQFDMLERHRLIRRGLAAHGFPGAVVSYDWPSNGSVLGYASDRRDARRAAEELFFHGIRWLGRMQRADCAYNVHVLAHSMGCFLVREACDYADDDHETAQSGWLVSQMAFVAADISQKSMRAGNANSSSLYRRCARLTNYYSLYDETLSVSEVKRVGVSPRLGRIGLPSGHPRKAVNLSCGEYFKDNIANPGAAASWSHRWYFEASRFYEDLNHSLLGKIDRDAIPSRGFTAQGKRALI
ncbi:alpha/beta fold hydrolase [Leisingera aquaemixtae]|uniref:alpha/beta fold hydrolase n=1 Tax=Leisingera aquaemixtae TaxID=1396826 RepID=UPI001C982225|nr:alpha/beta fold hydrolase [Leisingera aquaemixtae]MBY6067993.1 alpha/beta fold hydrolase [Leisingera aquaemixtae]